MGQREESKDDAGGENVSSHGMESWGWDRYAASFDVQSIREPAELLKGPQHLAAFVFYPASARPYRETQPGKQLIKRFRVPGVSTYVEYRHGAIGRDGTRVLDQRIHVTGQSTRWCSSTT